MPVKNPFQGYEIMPCRPVYTYEKIQRIQTQCSLLHGFAPIKGSNLIEIETAILKSIEKLEEEHTILSESHRDSVLQNLDLYDKKYIGFQKTIDPKFPGCLFFADIEERKEKDELLIGLILIEKLLGVYMWYNIDNDYMLDYVQEISSNDYYDDDHEEDENCPSVLPEDWQSSKRHISLMNGTELEIKDIASDYNFQKELTITTRKTIAGLWNLDLIPAIQTILERNSEIAIWLKGILYLIIHKFSLGNYRSTEEDSDNQIVPLERMFCIYARHDSWFMLNDSNDYDCSPGEMSLTTFVTEDKIIQPNPKIDHEWLIRIFSNLFEFNLTKSKFYASEKRNIQARFDYLDILGWESVLRRRIKHP